MGLGIIVGVGVGTPAGVLVGVGVAPGGGVFVGVAVGSVGVFVAVGVGVELDPGKTKHVSEVPAP